MKISKQALETLALPLFFLGIIDFFLFFEIFDGNSDFDTFNSFIIIALNWLAFFLITETGFNRLKTFVKQGIKSITKLITPILIAGFIIVFFSLPPMTIIIVLLILILFK